MLETPFSLPVDYIGPELSKGTLPTFIYFSVCAQESLHLAPYNTPAHLLKKNQVRIFSFTLPFHGPGNDKFKALEKWGHLFDQGQDPLATFFDQALEVIAWLQEKGWIDLNTTALGGLSRGAFIATHLAARLPEIKILLGFAPLTSLNTIQTFQDLGLDMSRYDLDKLTHNLLSLHKMRFYIANYDTLVDTDRCYHFIRTLTQHAHQEKVRHCSPELILTKAIGREGHGTAAETFEQGVQWLQTALNLHP